ncbi:hypothetical protein HMPREF0297_1061 [Corynebacterium jeikeium ATCC 43734]|nr:hypothetical protein HMPREF0297_1061 [Corynebacterium jeikeium ATCC 43734]
MRFSRLPVSAPVWNATWVMIMPEQAIARSPSSAGRKGAGRAVTFFVLIGISLTDRYEKTPPTIFLKKYSKSTKYLVLIG